MKYEVTVHQSFSGHWFVDIVFCGTCEETKIFKTKAAAEMWIGERIMTHAEALAMQGAG